jgi:Ca2+-binding EF-hand superfamily protein
MPVPAPMPQSDEEREAQRNFNVSMRQYVLDADALDVDGNRQLDFKEFCELVREREMGVQTAEVMRARFDAIDKDKSGTIDMGEFLLFAMRDTLARSAVKIGDLLASWDANGDGVVSRSEFRSAVRAMGVQAADELIDKAFDELDYTKSGELDQKDLIKRLQRESGMPKGVLKQQMRTLDWRKNMQGEDEASKLGSNVLDASKAKGTRAQRVATMDAQLKKFLRGYGGRLVDLFRTWDLDGDGLVDRKEFRRALKALGYDAPKRESDMMFDALDVDGGGKIEYHEIQALLAKAPSPTPLVVPGDDAEGSSSPSSPGMKASGSLPTLAGSGSASGGQARSKLGYSISAPRFLDPEYRASRPKARRLPRQRVMIRPPAPLPMASLLDTIGGGMGRRTRATQQGAEHGPYHDAGESPHSPHQHYRPLGDDELAYWDSRGQPAPWEGQGWSPADSRRTRMSIPRRYSPPPQKPQRPTLRLSRSFIVTPELSDAEWFASWLGGVGEGRGRHARVAVGGSGKPGEGGHVHTPGPLTLRRDA